MNKIKGIFNTLFYPKNYRGLLVFLTLMMKVSGIFPVKVVLNKNKIQVKTCKWGVGCTISHLIVYLSSLIANCMATNNVSLPGGTVGHFGDNLLKGTEYISTIAIFASVFYSMRFQQISVDKYLQVKYIYEELKIDTTPLIRQSLYLIYLLMSLLCFNLCFGVFLVIYTFNALFKILPPISVFFVTTLSHFYIFMKVSHFLVVAIMLNTTYKELINLLKKVIGK